MAPYRPLEDVSIADAAFEVVGKDLNEIFRDAALATFSEMVDIYAVKGAETREIKVEAEKLDDLMFKWLEQLIYLKDAENMWFNKFDVDVKKKGKNYSLEALVYGEPITQDPKKMRTDVKAITRHKLNVEEFTFDDVEKKVRQGWRATFVLDI